MIGCLPVLALTKVPSYSMTTIIAFQNGLQKSSSMKVWQSWKYKKFTGVAGGEGESITGEREIKISGWKGEIKHQGEGGGDKDFEEGGGDGACLGVCTLQGDGRRLAAHLELLGRVGRLHHHSLTTKWWKYWQSRPDSIAVSLFTNRVTAMVSSPE